MNIWNTISTITLPTLFVPTNIAGLELWLSALSDSSIITSNSNITQWNDLSGNSRNATPYSNSYPTYTASGVNNKTSVSFSSLNQGLYCPMPSGTLSSGMTVFIVYKQNYSVSSNGNLFNKTNSNLPAPVDMYNQGRLRGNGTLLSVSTSTLNLSSNSGNALAIFNMSSSMWKEWLNATSYLSNTATSSYQDTSSYFYISIRADKQVASYMNGYIGEILVYSSVLSNTNRQSVESYLKTKWEFSYSGLST